MIPPPKDNIIGTVAETFDDIHREKTIVPLTVIELKSRDGRTNSNGPSAKLSALGAPLGGGVGLSARGVGGGLSDR